MSNDWSSVVVVGLGAMGGSIVKALGLSRPEADLFGVEPSPESRDSAARAGVTVVEDLDAVDLTQAALVYATPLDVTVERIRADRAAWERAFLVTDVVSLQQPVLEAGGTDGAQYVSSHPMCGTATSGFGGARADLFTGARVWLSGGASGAAEPASVDAPAGASSLERVTSFWRGLGAEPLVVDAAAHDRRMVWVSHLPQLVSSALAVTLSRAGLDTSDLGPGGQGMTRLASSLPSMWRPLLAAVEPDPAEVLDRVIDVLNAMASALHDNDMDSVAQVMQEAATWKAGDV